MHAVHEYQTDGFKRGETPITNIVIDERGRNTSSDITGIDLNKHLQKMSHKDIKREYSKRVNQTT